MKSNKKIVDKVLELHNNKIMQRNKLIRLNIIDESHLTKDQKKQILFYLTIEINLLKQILN